MSFKFKIGDKVRIQEDCSIVFLMPECAGKEGIVTMLGGVSTPDEGAVVTNEEFSSGAYEYGEHGIWFPDAWLELI